jgi:hypothetical protein
MGEYEYEYDLGLCLDVVSWETERTVALLTEAEAGVDVTSLSEMLGPVADGFRGTRKLKDQIARQKNPYPACWRSLANSPALQFRVCRS